jgi:hypothetical protein
LGWVLHRDGKELFQYRIRRFSEGFQPVVYEHGFAMGEPDRNQTIDFKLKRDDNPFQIRKTWKQAVKDLFDYLSPGAIPIDRPNVDEWLPATSNGFS